MLTEKIRPLSTNVNSDQNEPMAFRENLRENGDLGDVASHWLLGFRVTVGESHFASEYSSLITDFAFDRIVLTSVKNGSY